MLGRPSEGDYLKVLTKLGGVLAPLYQHLYTSRTFLRVKQPSGEEMWRFNQTEFEELLTRKTNRLISTFETKQRLLLDRERLIGARKGNTKPRPRQLPRYWTVDPAFDPYHVRSNRRSIARAIIRALANHDYTPFAPVKFPVRNLMGYGVRDVFSYAIADTTLAALTLKQLRQQNKPILSQHCYGYRDDLSQYDAVTHLYKGLQESRQVFIAKYDLRKFSNHISHEYLWTVIERQQLYISPLQKEIVNSFLPGNPQTLESYQRFPSCEGQSEHQRTMGLPSGNPLSAFLLNVALLEADIQLEKLGVGFARYGDDILIWSPDKDKVDESKDVILEVSSAMGGTVNTDKSFDATPYLPNQHRTDPSRISKFEFLAFRISKGGIGIGGITYQRLIEKVSNIIWEELIEPIQIGGIDLNQVTTGFDLDYIRFISRLRTQIYGRMTETTIHQAIQGRIASPPPENALSTLALVTDSQQLGQLDGWMTYAIHSSLKKRAALLRAQGIAVLPEPHGLSKHKLINLKTVIDSRSTDLSLPSFQRLAAAMRVANSYFGPQAVSHGKFVWSRR